jgi:hypothetical protein
MPWGEVPGHSGGTNETQWPYPVRVTDSDFCNHWHHRLGSSKAITYRIGKRNQEKTDTFVADLRERSL